ncbi:MAG: hypothetical protein IGQ45_07480 [Cyanobacterium sp. T60_A2020_053]|nr:hypothetical protein [Cyanobacterium sp. T60_A2020_053]
MKTKENQAKQNSWWSRPLWGESSFVNWFTEWLKSLNYAKEEIPESTVIIYQDSLRQMKNIGALMRTIDSEKFTGREFISFLSINAQVSKDQGAFEGLKSSLDLLRVALETKDSFLKIEQTESRYRGYAQQDFYDYVYELLQQDLDISEFKKLVEVQVAQIIPKVKTEEGKAAIQSYCNQLDILSKDRLGLKLLALFKEYDLSNFSLLKTVAEIADSFYDKNLNSLKEFMVIVQINTEIFVKLGQIIKVPTAKNTPQTYALFLQYIAMRNRHQQSFAQFQQLVVLLKDWVRFYQPLIAIRKEYPPEDFKQPKVFEEEIPGLVIYEKYEQYLNAL